MVKKDIPCEYGRKHAFQSDIAGIAAGCGEARAFDILTRHKPEQIAGADGCRTAVDVRADFDRQTHKDQHVGADGGFENTQKRIPCTAQQHIMGKEIPTRAACDAQFRKHQHIDTPGIGFVDAVNNPFRIEFRICHTDHRGSCGYFNKSVFH